VQEKIEKPERKVSAIIQDWMVQQGLEITRGEALCAIYKRYNWLWGDIPREKGNEVCAYLKTVDAEKNTFVGEQ